MKVRYGWTFLDDFFCQLLISLANQKIKISFRIGLKWKSRSVSISQKNHQKLPISGKKLIFLKIKNLNVNQKMMFLIKGLTLFFSIFFYTFILMVIVYIFYIIIIKYNNLLYKIYIKFIIFKISLKSKKSSKTLVFKL